MWRSIEGRIQLLTNAKATGSAGAGNNSFFSDMSLQQQTGLIPNNRVQCQGPLTGNPDSGSEKGGDLQAAGVPIGSAPTEPEPWPRAFGPSGPLELSAWALGADPWNLSKGPPNLTTSGVPLKVGGVLSMPHHTLRIPGYYALMAHAVVDPAPSTCRTTHVQFQFQFEQFQSPSLLSHLIPLLWSSTSITPEPDSSLRSVLLPIDVRLSTTKSLTSILPLAWTIPDFLAYPSALLVVGSQSPLARPREGQNVASIGSPFNRCLDYIPQRTRTWKQVKHNQESNNTNGYSLWVLVAGLKLSSTPADVSRRVPVFDVTFAYTRS
ncbi:hypothetical protein NM208_g13847 [Fusarium decemcellulare]|uniref:Uncharacterized protein n=1 Tax=Fusarium decemcellulare TaxID=57161 RepID=A0ACC1RIW9_9HYPO|nr:hypothetical protein NM208_g13847 [Fusarium decemcellulare]